MGDRSRRTRRIVGVLAVLVAVCLLVGAADRLSLSYIHGAQEQPVYLWIAALKHMEGPVYYVGTDGDFSYFRAGYIFFTRYKARTSMIRLPRTFPFGTRQPYLVTEDMVPPYAPAAKQRP